MCRYRLDVDSTELNLCFLHTGTVAVAQATLANWLCDFAVSESFLAMTDALGEAGTFGLYAALSAIGVVVIYLFLPETAGLRLEGIDAAFQQPMMVRRPGGDPAPIRLVEE